MDAYSVTARPRRSSKRSIRLDVARQEIVLTRMTIMRLGCIPSFASDTRTIPLDEIRWVARYPRRERYSSGVDGTWVLATRGGVVFVSAKWEMADRLVQSLGEILPPDHERPFWHRAKVQIWWYALLPPLAAMAIGGVVLMVAWFRP